MLQLYFMRHLKIKATLRLYLVQDDFSTYSSACYSSFAKRFFLACSRLSTSAFAPGFFKMLSKLDLNSMPSPVSSVEDSSSLDTMANSCFELYDRSLPIVSISEINS